MNLGVAWQLARGLALSTEPVQRWRQLGAVAGSFLATLAVLAGIALALLGSRADTVVDARSVGEVPSRAQASMVFALRGIVVPEFAQVPVISIDPLGDPDAVAPPPGLDEWPEPGTAVLSPGLVDAGYTAQDFGSRPSEAGSGAGGAIGDAGLTSRTEGFVWVRPAQTPPVDGQGPWSFGEGFGHGNLVPVEAYSDTPGGLTSLFGAGILLWAPAAYLLVASATGMSPVRDERAEVLHAMGARTGTIRWIAALETLVLSGLGALLGWLVWNLALAPMTAVPLTGRVIVPGSAHVPLWATALVVLGVTALSGYLAAAGRVLPAPVRHRARRHRAWHSLPLVVGVATMWCCTLFTGNQRLLVLAVGLLVSVAASGLALPLIVRWLAPRVVPQGRTSAWLACQRLMHSTHLLTRPAALVAVLVALAVASFGVMGAAVKGVDSGMPTFPRELYVVSWEGEEAGVAPEPGSADLRSTELWVPTPAVPPRGNGEDAPSYVTWGDCEEARAFIGGRDACPGSAGWSPSVQLLWQALGVTPDRPAERPPGYRTVILVSAEPDVPVTEVMRAFPGRDALLVEQTTGESAFELLTPRWVRLGIAVAALLLFTGILREAGDRVQLALRDTAVLRRVGLRQPEIDGVHRRSLLVPMAVAGPVGLVIGIVFTLRGVSTGMTTASWATSAVVATIVLVASVAGTFLAIRLGERAD